MKKIKILAIVFIFSLICLISGCGKPNEFIPKFKIISESYNPGYAQSVWVDSINHKNYAFVASGQAGMVIYNIDNPESTYIVAQWMDSMNTCWDVTTLKGYAYLAYGKRELIVIDSQNLDSLRYIDECSWPTPGNSYDIFIQDTSNIYIGVQDRLLIAPVSAPAYPEEYDPPHYVRGVFAVDSFAYLACEQLGVYIMNVKTTPRKIIGMCNSPSNARGLFVSDNTCYVADGRDGLVIIDITNPRQTQIISELDLSGYANRVFVKDSLAYVACEDAGLSIVNVKNRTQPFLVETVKTSYAKGVFVPDGPYIYVADRDEGLIIIKQEE